MPSVAVLRSARLGTAAALAVLVVSLAGPVAGASATTAPTAAQVSSALSTVVSPTLAVTLSTDIANLQYGLSTSSLSTIDTALNGVLGALGVTLPTGSASTGPALESTLTALGNLLPAHASAAQQQAITEAQTALTDNGLGALLTGLTTGANVYSAESELTALQQFAPGAATYAGDTKAVGVIVAKLATEAGSATDAATLNAVASSIGANNTVTLAQMESAISGLGSITSTSVSGTAGVTVAQVAHALASQLAQSGPVLGALANAGAGFSALTDPTDITTATGQLAALAGLEPGQATPMTQVGATLAAIAATPGISGTAAATTLSSVAGSFSSAADASGPELWSAVSTLETVAPSLPGALDSLALAVAYEIGTSPVDFGTISGLQASQVTDALGELATLAGLGPGASTPALPGIAGILDRVSYDLPGSAASVASALEALVPAISENALSPDQLAGTAEVLAYVVAALPSSGEKTAIAGLTTELSADAIAMGGTAGVTAPLTPSVNSAPSAADTPSSTTTTVAPRSQGLLQRTRRSGDTLTLTLYCNAVAAHGCSDTITARGSGLRSISRTVKIGASVTRTVTLTLTPRTRGGGVSAARTSARRPTIRLAVSSGGYRATRTLR